MAVRCFVLLKRTFFCLFVQLQSGVIEGF